MQRSQCRLIRKWKLSFLRTVSMLFTAVLVAGLAGIPTHAWAAARAGSDPEPVVEELIPANDLVRTIQTMLTNMGYYDGPSDGRMNAALRKSIKAYQKRLGRKVDGEVSEELAKHMETQSKVGAMLRHIDEVREKNIEAAKKALLSNDATRELLTKSTSEEVADPTRDSSPCFQKPAEKCLLEEAVESAKAIHKAELRDWALGEILVAQAKAGFLDGAISTVRRIGDARLIIVALRDIARAQARAGRIKEAWEAAQIIPRHFQRLEALTSIADIQIKNGDNDGAHETAAQIILMSDRLKDPLQHVTLLAQMAVVLTKIGDIGGAEDALVSAQKIARSQEFTDKLSELEKGAALRHVASAFAEIGQPTRALSLIKEVTGAYDRTAVLMSAATAQATSGDTIAALATSKKIESNRYRSVVQGRIAVALARKGELARAARTISKALDSTNDIELPYARSYAIGQLTLSLVEIGVNYGNGNLIKAADTANEIENDRLRAYALWTVAAAQAKKGLRREVGKTEKLALEATDAIGSTLSQVWMLGDIATENIQAGQIDRAAKAFKRGIVIAESIQNVWGRARALAKMAITLHEFP